MNSPSLLAWPGTGVTEVPFRVYTDPAIFDREMERIFYGDNWAYLGLAAELP
jgi:salicylate 5-hydroxylase large subunit